MKRNELTTVGQLIIGDRFYKHSDKGENKSVYQLMDPEKQIRTANQKHFACPVSHINGKFETQKTIPISENLPVVFLVSTFRKELDHA